MSKIIRLRPRVDPSNRESVRCLCTDYAQAFPENVAKFHEARSRRIGMLRRIKELFLGK